jgi:hypothetical protein
MSAVTAGDVMGGSGAGIWSLLAGILAVEVLAFFGGSALMTVVTCAAYRAVLEPDDSAFLYLRLGKREGGVFLALFAQVLIIVAVLRLTGAPLEILVGMAGRLHTPDAAISALRVLWLCLQLGLTLWLAARLSLSGPMTFAEQHFRLLEAWQLTRGQVWRLLGVALLVGSVVAAVHFALVIFAVVGGAAILGSRFAALVQARSPMALIPALAPLAGFGIFLLLAAGAVVIPVTMTPWARAYQRLAAKADPVEAPV